MASSHALRLLCAAAYVCALSSAAPVATLLWEQSQPDATYTSAAVSLHGASAPTFATATSGLDNWPVLLEVINASGTSLWTYTSPADDATSFDVVSARHAERQGVGAVDTVVVEGDKDAADDVWLRGFAALGAGAPAWSLRVSACRVATGLAVSDDGSAAALATLLVDAASGSLYPQLIIVDAQTGAVRVNVTRAVGGPGGPVSMSETGAWVAWTQGDSAFVYDGATGALRGEAIAMGWNTAAQLTDTGDEVVFSGLDAAQVWAWDAASGVYTLAQRIVPSGATQWYSESCAVSSNSPTYGPLAAFGWITSSALQARVTVYALKTGTLVADYTSLPNAQLQTSASVRMDGDYVGVALWGDRDDVPTAVVLRAGAPAPVFTYVTPGSMAGVDIAADGSGDLFFAVAGRDVPANVMGKGGDAYAWRIAVA